MIKKLLILAVVVLTTISLSAQKKALSIDDFAKWKTISGQQISEDGTKVVYELKENHGNSTTVIKSLKGGSEVMFERASGAKISPDGTMVAFKISPSLELKRDAVIKELKKDKQPKDSVAVYLIKSEELVKFNNVSSFRYSKDKDIFTLLEEQELKADTTSVEAKEDKKDKKKKKAEKIKSIKIVQNIDGKLSIKSIDDVKEYILAKNGETVLFTKEIEKDSTKFITVNISGSDKIESKEIFNAEGSVKSLTLSEDGTKAAFLFSNDTIDNKSYTLQLFAGETTETVAKLGTDGLNEGMEPSSKGSVRFSKNGERLFFGVNTAPLAELKDTLLRDENVSVDIWNWQDKLLVPRQKANQSRINSLTYKAVVDTDSKTVIQLASKDMPSLSTFDDDNSDIAIGANGTPYERAMDWTGNRYSDLYVVDVNSGERRSLATAAGRPMMSPEQKYAVLWDPRDSAYISISTETLKRVNISDAIPTAVFNELQDTPSDSRSYGTAGFSSNGEELFIYDMFDIWKVSLDGSKAPVNVTKGAGRDNNVVYRYTSLDREEKTIDTKGKILLSAFYNDNKDAGCSLGDFNKGKAPKQLVRSAHLYGTPIKAKDSDVLCWSKQSFTETPNLYVSDLSFSKAEIISDANPQQKDFNWGYTELVSWTGFHGKKLEGFLIYPEDFDPTKSYPMVSYFYERSVNTINRYNTPAPSRSTINKSFYPSNGYIVFVPDIIYTDGYPGQSAYDAIVSGVQIMCDRYQFIDRDRLALQGQSWGGYQTAYLVTQTDMFAAAMAGAVVSNMTSAYGGIRWDSGLNRMFQYEHTQSRIGGTLWDKTMKYIENSPIFFVDKVKTPLMLMHNDKDGAVPWYQGIEMFVSMRRLDKPCWMVSYNNEPHNLKGTSWGNRIDLSTRMFSFFNHYLKGDKMPQWMEEGVPTNLKHREMRY